MGKVNVQTSGQVLRLTLADPDSGNLLTDDVLTDMLDAMCVARGKAEILVLTAEGPVFSVGRPKTRPPATESDHGAVAVPLHVQKALGMVLQINTELRQWPGISIAAVRGEAHGAAAGFAVHADVVLAAAGTRFSFPEINYDLPPALVNSYLTKWLPPKAAHYMVSTGQPISVETAHAWGLVSEVLPAERLEQRLDELVTHLAQRRPGALRYNKEALLEFKGMPDDEAGRRGLARVIRWLGGDV